MKRFLKLFSLFSLLFCFSVIHSFVGTVVSGQALWCITKRIGETVDIIESKICEIDSTIDALMACGPTTLSSSDIVAGAIILSTAGNYCLSEDVTANITISADCVSLDLNQRCLTGVISVSSDDIEVKNGNVTPAPPTSGPAAAITITSASDRAHVSDVLIICADTSTPPFAGAGRDGIEVEGNDTQILDTTIKSGAGGDDSNGGKGIFVGASANNAVIKNCIISTGNGGDSGGGSGGNGGDGISVEAATETEVTDTTILFTGNGGTGFVSGGVGGDAVFINSGAEDTVIRNCTMRNTGAAGAGPPGGRAGRAIEDQVIIVANLSMCYSNFAHNIANSIKYNLQAAGTEQGVALANPPTATVVNSFANAFVS